MKSMGISEDIIDYVVTEIKDLLSKVEITDEVLRQCKYDSMNFSAFLWNKYCECKNDYIEYEREIKRCLFEVAEALIKLVRESENFESDVLIHISNSVDDVMIGLQKISDYMKENFGNLDYNSQIVLNLLLVILEQIQEMNMQCNETKNTSDEKKKFKNNKKEDYIANWNNRLFLHIDNDENPITLKDAYIVPDYEMYKSIKRIRFSDNDTLDQIIEKFVNFGKTSTMLITGVPGIGKSTITSWIANKYKDNERIIVLRFRDWKKVILEKKLLEAICKKLDCEEEDLESKVLVLDGFDEMKALNIRDRLLNEFFADIKDFENFKCIITSRLGYIDSSQFHNVLILNKFDIKRVEDFVKIITGDVLKKRERIEPNLEVLGIPVILYMAVMSNIDISENPTKPELYNRIFAEKGGIFDRFSCDGLGYDKGVQVLRNGENIKSYLSFLQKVAFLMFENNSLSLKMDDCNVPELEFQGDKVSVLEFPIKHLFENTEINVEFIHKSIYEYFVSEYIFSSLLTAIDSSTDELAKILGYLFKYNSITNEVLEFLGFKIINSKLNKEFNAMDKAFKLMLQDGMIYYTKENYKNAFKREMDVFSNMLEILHLWKVDYLKFDNSIAGYLRYNRNSHLNLKGAILRAGEKDNDGVLSLTKGLYLKDVYLEGANLEGANLTGAYLYGANLKGANLREADLREANLKEVDLRGADLSLAKIQDINLEDAKLEKATFDQKQFEYLKNKCDFRGVIKNVL